MLLRLIYKISNILDPPVGPSLCWMGRNVAEELFLQESAIFLPLIFAMSDSGTVLTGRETSTVWYLISVPSLINLCERRSSSYCFKKTVIHLHNFHQETRSSSQAVLTSGNSGTNVQQRFSRKTFQVQTKEVAKRSQMIESQSLLVESFVKNSQF